MDKPLFHKKISFINNLHKKTEQIDTHVQCYTYLHSFNKLHKFWRCCPKGTFTFAGHYDTNLTRVWWAKCCSPVKKSARPLTSSCAPSVTSTVPTWDCQTAASTPRYCHHSNGTKCSQQPLLLYSWKISRLTVNLVSLRHLVKVKLNCIYNFIKININCELSSSQVTHLFDNGATVFFAVFMAVWGKLNTSHFRTSFPAQILSS